ncbi:Protein F13G3.3 b [Aphelenchoides avenae]|nr:Protein F13G3.3 b [Aphelenchus avenae]
MFEAENAFDPLPWSNFRLYCWSENATNTLAEVAVVRQAFGSYCRIGAYIAECPVVDGPSDFGISTVASDVAKLPFDRPVAEKFDLVLCSSPHFYAERWQLIITQIELYRQFGVSKQAIYVHSMRAEIVEFIRAYERRGFATVVPWAALILDDRMHAELGYIPVREMEWNNLAAAYTHCLIQHKDSAEFIMFSDADDMLFAKAGRTYLDEFRRLSARQPLAAGFLYQRFNADYKSTLNPSRFSLSGILKSVRISNDVVAAKYVVRPSRVHSAWLHAPGIVDRPYSMIRVPAMDNFVVHLRRWREVDRHTGSISRQNTSTYTRNITALLSRDAITVMNQRFNDFVHQYGLEEFSRLPKDMTYYPLFEKCYHDSFYAHLTSLTDVQRITCPGPHNCEVPPLEGVKCVVAKQAGYRRESLLPRVTLFFFPKPAMFVMEEDGCTL